MPAHERQKIDLLFAKWIHSWKVCEWLQPTLMSVPSSLPAALYASFFLPLAI